MYAEWIGCQGKDTNQNNILLFLDYCKTGKYIEQLKPREINATDKYKMNLYCLCYVMYTYQCFWLDMFWLWRHLLFTSLRQDHMWGIFWVWLGVGDPVLISCSWGRPRFLVGLAHSCGPAASTQTWRASCLLISTAVFSSSPAQPQARAASSTGSEVVASRTVSSHSTRHCGRLDQRQSWPAERPLPFILLAASLAARPVPVVMPEFCFFSLSPKNQKNHKGIFPPAFKKWMEFLRFPSHMGMMVK